MKRKGKMYNDDTLLEDIRAYMQASLPSCINFRFDPSHVTGTGAFLNQLSQKKYGTILAGISDFNARSDDSIVGLLKTCFHEYRHVEQFLSNCNCCGKYARECRFDAIACSGSTYYYGSTDPFGRPIYSNRYFHNLREMDAEQYGIISTYHYLEEHPLIVSFVNPEDAILHYLNSNYLRISTVDSIYFVDFNKTLYSLSNVIQMFEAHMVRYANEKAEDYNAFHERNSSIGVVFGLDGFPREFMANEINSAENGMVQRRLVAGICRFAHPEYTKDLAPEEKHMIDLHDLISPPDRIHIPFFRRKGSDILPDAERYKYYSRNIRELPVIESLDVLDLPAGKVGSDHDGDSFTMPDVNMERELPDLPEDCPEYGDEDIMSETGAFGPGR